MKTLPQVLAIFIAILLSTASLEAAPLRPASPFAVQMLPKGAVLQVRETLAVQLDKNGDPYCIFVLPSGGDALHFAQKSPILRHSVESITVETTGAVATLSNNLQRRVVELEGRLATNKASMALLEHRANNPTFHDLTQQIQAIRQQMPNMLLEQSQLAKEIQVLKDRLEDMDESSQEGLQVTVWLDVPANTSKVTLEYDYTLQNCGWRPQYVFDAQPGNKIGEDTVNVRLNAELWQYSGIDWAGAKIALITQSQGPREPAKLPSWIIEDRENIPGERISVGAKAIPMMVAEETMPVQSTSKATRNNSAVAIDTQSLFARFDISSRGLQEGRSQIHITDEILKTPLTWLARPVRGNTRVWVMANCNLSPKKVWPSGKASFYIDGQCAGEGQFSPKGDEVTLYFGADPRVNLAILGDVRKRGERGFIGKHKNWQWGWTYELSNQHSRAITVRLERPLPQIINEKVNLRHNNAPEATIDVKKHLLYWNIDIPANSKMSVQHGMEISAPEEVQMSPIAP